MKIILQLDRSERRRILSMLKVLLEEKNMSMYKLEKLSNVSHATLSDLYNEKTNAEKCSSSLIYNIAKALNMNMEKLYEILNYDDLSLFSYSDSFDLFKSNVCHELKQIEYKDFLKKYLFNNKIQILYDNNRLLEAFYLLSMIDYLCEQNNLPIPKEYQSIREKKLDKIYVSKSVYLLLKNKLVKVTDLFKEALPTFIMHNIMEAEIENVR